MHRGGNCILTRLTCQHYCYVVTMVIVTVVLPNVLSAYCNVYLVSISARKPETSDQVGIPCACYGS